MAQGQFGHGKGVTERYAELDPLFQKEATAAIEALWQELQRSGDTFRSFLEGQR